MESPTLPGPADPANLFGELEVGLAAGASDWQFRGGEPCWIRVGGDVRRLDQAPLDEPRLQALAMAALGVSFPVKPGTDAAFAYGGDFFRLHAYSAGGVFCCNLRHVPGRIRPLEELGVPPAFREAALASPRGLVLVSGPAGSGKSTTLAAAIDHLNARQDGVILTFEDPIEFRHRSRRSLVRQMEQGLDFTTFAEALRGSLRSDPDVILVGEMRDRETIAAALTAAETGHLVLGTLHCGTARDAVSRIIDAFPAERAAEVRLQLAKSLVAVLAQQLVRRRDGRLTGAFELLLATHGVRHLIAEPGGRHPLIANEIATGSAHGMIAMDQSLEDLCRRKVIDRAEALKWAVQPAALESLLAGRDRVTMAAGRWLLAAGLVAPAALPAPPDLPWAVYRLAPATAPDPLDAAVRSFRVAQAPIVAAFLAVSRSYGVTFVLDPALKGEVSLELRQGTVREVIDALARSQGLYWQREGRLIAVRRNVTRCYEIDYPQMTRSAQGGSSVNLSAQAGPAPAAGPAGLAPAGPAAGQNDQTNLTILQQNQNTFWADLQSELALLAQAGESVVVNKFAGLAVITAPPARQEDFRAFLATVNRRISRQVRIVARVVEVELNAQHQLGVDWSLAGLKAGGLTLGGLGTATGFSALGGQTLAGPTITGTLATGGISAVLGALRQQGEVRALSNPSVLSLSNQTAFVKVGTEQTFFSLQNSTTINQAGVTAPIATTQANYAQNAITIGTVLYVTPEVNGDGTVTVDVLPAITQLVGVDTSPDGQQTAPRMDIKALSTIARLRRDQSVMIGGLIYEATASQSRQVPGLADLPLVGRAFGTTARTRSRTELVIFLAAESVD